MTSPIDVSGSTRTNPSPPMQGGVFIFGISHLLIAASIHSNAPPPSRRSGSRSCFYVISLLPALALAVVLNRRSLQLKAPSVIGS